MDIQYEEILEFLKIPISEITNGTSFDTFFTDNGTLLAKNNSNLYKCYCINPNTLGKSFTAINRAIYMHYVAKGNQSGQHYAGFVQRFFEPIRENGSVFFWLNNDEGSRKEIIKKYPFLKKAMDEYKNNSNVLTAILTIPTIGWMCFEVNQMNIPEDRVLYGSVNHFSNIPNETIIDKLKPAIEKLDNIEYQNLYVTACREKVPIEKKAFEDLTKDPSKNKAILAKQIIKETDKAYKKKCPDYFKRIFLVLDSENIIWTNLQKRSQSFPNKVDDALSAVLNIPQNIRIEKYSYMEMYGVSPMELWDLKKLEWKLNYICRGDEFYKDQIDIIVEKAINIVENIIFKQKERNVPNINADICKVFDDFRIGWNIDVEVKDKNPTPIIKTDPTPVSGDCYDILGCYIALVPQIQIGSTIDDAYKNEENDDCGNGVRIILFKEELDLLFDKLKDINPEITEEDKVYLYAYVLTHELFHSLQDFSVGLSICYNRIINPINPNDPNNLSQDDYDFTETFAEFFALRFVKDCLKQQILFEALVQERILNKPNGALVKYSKAVDEFGDIANDYSGCNARFYKKFKEWADRVVGYTYH